jgi:hypothetical protein
MILFSCVSFRANNTRTAIIDSAFPLLDTVDGTGFRSHKQEQITAIFSLIFCDLHRE